MINEQFNTGTDTGYIKALDKLHYYKSKGAIIEIVEKKQTTSEKQRRALHLYFKFCCDALNDSGFEFAYRGIKGMEIEIPWNTEMFKEYVWRRIQITLFDIQSTTKINTSQINQIYDVLNRHISNTGISISFPNNFDYWLKKAEHY